MEALYKTKQEMSRGFAQNARLLGAPPHPCLWVPVRRRQRRRYRCGGATDRAAATGSEGPSRGKDGVGTKGEGGGGRGGCGVC